ncbi:MAG: RDD family protein [Proteobacteria bacterium]|nr:RDD family protein [Pseudomonadota bacterium]
MATNPPTAPDAGELEYVGFWARVGAAMIDTLLLLVICAPLVTLVYGRTYWTSEAFLQGPADFLINWLLPAIAVVVFWVYRQATPGKIAIAARIVDAGTGGRASTRQLVIRYLGYYVSMLPLMAGIVWVAFDPRKQGWHDKLAGTVVVRPRQRGPARVDFPKQGTP